MEILIPQSPHFRNIIGIIIAVVIGVIVVGTIESIGHAVYPPPADLDFDDAEMMKEYVATLPATALLFVIAAWSAGIFIGNLIAGIMGEKQGTFCCLVYSLLFASMTIWMLVIIPSPLWFSMTGIAVLFPSAFAGWKISRITLKRWGKLAICSGRVEAELISENEQEISDTGNSQDEMDVSVKRTDHNNSV